MANIAKRFATMTLLYWEPEYTGSGIKHNEPVEFKGFYLTNANILGDEVAKMIGSLDDRTNLVLFYMLEPKPEGCVSWHHRLEDLEEQNLMGLPPNDIPNVHVIKRVAELPMIRSRRRALKDLAFLCAVE